MVAFARRHTQALNSIVRVLPFTCLPLVTMMNDHQPHLETFQAALDSLDVHLLRRSDPGEVDLADWWGLGV